MAPVGGLHIAPTDRWMTVARAYRSVCFGVGSSHHAATAPVDPFRPYAASVNDRFRLGAVGQVGRANDTSRRDRSSGEGTASEREWPKADVVAASLAIRRSLRFARVARMRTAA